MADEKKFDVLYFKKDYKTNEKVFSHKYTENWGFTDYFCPSCGVKTVWQADDGDYYVGSELICTSCESSFYMPNGTDKKSGCEQQAQRLAALKS